MVILIALLALIVVLRSRQNKANMVQPLKAPESIELGTVSRGSRRSFGSSTATSHPEVYFVDPLGPHTGHNVMQLHGSHVGSVDDGDDNNDLQPGALPQVHPDLHHLTTFGPLQAWNVEQAVNPLADTGAQERYAPMLRNTQATEGFPCGTLWRLSEVREHVDKMVDSGDGRAVFENAVELADEGDSTNALRYTKHNRYANILPYDENAVPRNEAAGIEYVNASFVDGYSHGEQYILAQTPMPHTINSFWHVLLHYQTPVMLTFAGAPESQFWPDRLNRPLNLAGGLSVVLVSEVTKHPDTWVTRQFRITRSVTGQSHVVTQLFLSDSSPAAVTAAVLARFTIAGQHYQDKSNVDGAPLVVMDDVGAGLPGMVLLLQLSVDVGLDTGRVDVARTCIELLTQRRQAIQAPGQFEMVCHALAHVAAINKALINDPDAEFELEDAEIVDYIRDLTYITVNDGSSQVHEQVDEEPLFVETQLGSQLPAYESVTPITVTGLLPARRVGDVRGLADGPSAAFVGSVEFDPSQIQSSALNDMDFMEDTAL